MTQRLRLLALMFALLIPISVDAQQAASTVASCPTKAATVSQSPGTFCYRADTSDLFVWTGSAWNRVLTESSRSRGRTSPRTLPIYANDFVTGGDGTSSNPWTGWDPAVASAIPREGGTIVFDAGYYKYTSPIVIRTMSTSFVGAGASNNKTDAATVLLYEPTAPRTSAIVCDGTVIQGCARAYFEGFMLKQTNAAPQTNGLLLRGHQNTVRRVSIINFTNVGLGLWANESGPDAIWNRVYDLYAEGNLINLHLRGLAARNRVVNSNMFYGLLLVMPTAADGGNPRHRNIKIEGPASDNGFFGFDASPSDTGTGLEVGDGVNTCRGNLFWAATLEGSAGSRNYNIHAPCNAFLHGFFTAAGGGTIDSGAKAWVLDTRQAGWYTHGPLDGIRFDARGNIGAGPGANPPQNGINVAGNYYIGDSVAVSAFGNGVLRLAEGSSWSGVTFKDRFLEGEAIPDPAVPAAERGRLYFRRDRSGKLQLVVRFKSGPAQVLAAEP